MTIEQFIKICKNRGLYVVNSPNEAYAYHSKNASNYKTGWFASCNEQQDPLKNFVRVAADINHWQGINIFGGIGYKTISEEDLEKEIEDLQNRYKTVVKDWRKQKIEEL